MRGLWKRSLALAMAVCVACTLPGCQRKKEKPEATASNTAGADSSAEKATTLPKVQAGGKGKNKSDVPLVVACDSLEKKFNPFSANCEEDCEAVDFTQLRLLTFDREGALVRHAIDGEERRFNGEDFRYQGPANVRIRYDEEKKQTTYVIRIREDIVFSDGKPVTIDDVIFSMYAFADPSYEGSETFGKLSVAGLEKYQKWCKSAAGRSDLGRKRIEGIEKVNEYKVRVTINGYNSKDIWALNIPICPLHFYGDAKNFNVLASCFGFEQGDISSLLKKKSSPMGAGAYRFIKYENGVVYYEANEQYYLGCPQTAFIQLKEIGDKTPHEKLEALAEGEFDVVDMPGSNMAIDLITRTNSSGKLTGRIYGGKLYDGARYAYIGMNADRVCVDEKSDSTRSKCLRQALAILFSCNRNNVVALYEKGSAVINYPASNISWSVPQVEDEEYQLAYVRNVDGEVVYNSNMETAQRSEAACKAALGYLKQAGFAVKKGKIVSAPDNTDTHFKIYVPKDASSEAMLTLAHGAKVLFKQIGLRLTIVSGHTQQQIKRILKGGKHQLWCGYAPTSVDGALYNMYHSGQHGDKKAGSDNYFHIADSDLDEYIEDSLETVQDKKSIALYEQCYEKILDWAVEVPFYQEQNLTVFSTARVNLETVAQDISSYYGWKQELHMVEMK